MTSRTGALLVFFSLSIALGGCAGAALRAAERGEYDKLRVEIAGKHARGALSNDEAADLARAVAEREISSAKDVQAALSRLDETRACTDELEDALEARMHERDDAGAEAALALLEDGKLSESDAREWLGDADDHWRSVAARALGREKDREARHRMLVDPSARVRRSAIRASARAKDPTDLDLLAETARVDPELLLRNEALRAESAIVRAMGDRANAQAAELALRLRDLWTTGDDPIREAVAVAWALSPVFENGGREALRVTVAGPSSQGSIAAAGVVARSRQGDAELATSANALLARTIEDGSRRDRLHALSVAPLDAPELEATRKAAKDEDRDVRIAALGRLLASEPDRGTAERELLEIARYGTGPRSDKDDGRARELAVRARMALASAGDLRVQAWVEQDLSADDPERRARAASALAAMGRAARAAPLLADPDASIRTRTACTILVAARRRP